LENKMNENISILDKVIWFCSSCESSNKITDLNCADCGTPFKAGDTVFNIETLQATTPEKQCGSQSYFVDGGSSPYFSTHKQMFGDWNK